jgi:hypothetical protein
MPDPMDEPNERNLALLGTARTAHVPPSEAQPGANVLSPWGNNARPGTLAFSDS